MPDGVPGVFDGVPDVLGQVRVGVFGVLAVPALPTCVQSVLALLCVHGFTRMPRGLRVLQVLANAILSSSVRNACPCVSTYVALWPQDIKWTISIAHSRQDALEILLHEAHLDALRPRSQ